MTNLTTINLTDLKLKDLQTLAKEFKIKNWWLMNKASLTSELISIKLNQEDQEAVRKANEELRKEQKEKEAPKPQSPKVEKNEENLVTLKELAAEFNMKGTKARRLLRNETAARPFGSNRWEWDKELHKEALDQAREILKSHIK